MNDLLLEAISGGAIAATLILAVCLVVSWRAHKRDVRAFRTRVQLLTHQLAKAETGQRGLVAQLDAMRKELEAKRAQIRAYEPVRGEVSAEAASSKVMNELFVGSRRPRGNDFEETQIL